MVFIILRLFQEIINKEKYIFRNKLFYYYLELSCTNRTLISIIEPDIDILDKEVV
jgi:hypothetical protein